MRLIQKLLCLLAMCAFAGAAAASPADPKNGVEYLTLANPQATDSGKKIEVIEFFAYYCPHCHAFEPALADWVRKQGANIVFKRIHISYDARVEPQQRLFYTLEAMGLVDQYQAKVFDAMHVDHLPLARDEQVFDWVEKAGIKRSAFIDTYRSFGVQAKLRRTPSLMESYKVDQWPMIIIDGRFQTSPSQANQGMGPNQTEAQQQQGALLVMSHLVAAAKAEKK